MKLATMAMGSSRRQLVAMAVVLWASACRSERPTGLGSDGSPSDSGPPPGGDAAVDAGLPTITLGEPIQAPDGVWTTVPFPNGYCRDGTQAHLAVHLNSASKKFAIYLEGGGACFNDTSCKLLTFDFPSYEAGEGIFNFTRADNPVRDWNIFYVPYCTGDVHAGHNATGEPGPLTGPQNYTGWTNLELYLSRILATVPDATDELLMGASAGGFGTGLTAGLVVRNVPASVERFTMLDDSGQPMSSQYIQPCLQDLWRQVWGFDSTFLAECGSACSAPNNWVYPWIEHLLTTSTEGTVSEKFEGGLISWTGDAVISTFYGFGANDCKGNVPVPLNSAVFEAGLLDFRQMAQAKSSLFGTYFASGTNHTFLLLNNATAGFLGGLYDTTVGGVRLVDWIADLLAHKPTTHVGP
jgi:hypothetical protein